jgi:hypothetical protein
VTGVVSGRVAVRAGRGGAEARAASAVSLTSLSFAPLVAALAAVFTGAAFTRAAMLAALGAGSSSSFGSLAAPALVGRLLPLSSASGASLLVSLRPATMIVVKFAPIFPL